MIKSKNKISYNNEGSAIITALVVSTVLMVLCLSLLAIAYSLFLSQKNSSSDLPEREMLYSAVELFEEGILGAKYSPDGIAVYDDSDTADTSLKNFGELLLTEIWNGFEGPDVNGRYYQPDTSDEWLYYDINASGAHANLDYKPGVNKICSKFFNLTSIGSNKIIAQCLLTFIWKNRIEISKYIIKDRVNLDNVNEILEEFV
ncbi:MAG: hypothetical protein IK007_11015, partial [Lachnospiraceae bacterium]|nr:hypothetical protein [Lachnospiraceae bacterium]